MRRISLMSTAVLAAAALASCGGSPSSSTAPVQQAPQTPPAVVFSGVAATGAPMAGARVDVYDHSGSSVCNVTTTSDGHYSCTLPSSAVEPFVLTAVLDNISLVSAYAKAETTTLNVTPITNLIAARLASNGDPAQLRQDVVANASAVTSAKLDTKVAEFIAAVQPLLTAAGDQVNPLTGSFSADGSGHDRVLDSLQISIRPAGASANVEITLKVQPAAPETPPVSLSFNTADTTVPTITAPVSSGDLVATGIASSVADLASRIQACYAVPLDQRVSGSTLAAAACRTIFIGDDPTGYLHDGARVGPTGAFGGMFGANATGLLIDRANFEHLTSDGDVVFTYRYKSVVTGNADFVALQARRVGSMLKLIGNQAVYSAVVVPMVERRDFVNSPAFNYRSTGYGITVGNRVNSQGQPIFTKVEATAPDGHLFTLRPRAGLSYLALVRENGTLTVTAQIKLAARFTDSSTPGNPADKDTDPLYAGVQFTDLQLKSLPDHGVWKIEYFHADGTTPNLTQYVRTLTRALTLDEAMVQPIATVTDAAKAALVSAGASGWGVIFFSTAPSADAPNWVNFSAPLGGDFWAVPEGGVAPYQIAAYGNGPVPVSGGARTFFNDYLSVASTARQATVKCSVQSAGDKHCDASIADSYAADAYLTSLQLLARTQQQLRVSNLTALWTLH